MAHESQSKTIHEEQTSIIQVYNKTYLDLRYPTLGLRQAIEH